ncbi:MAG: 30S ribosomal protein S4e [DPANN group archaeon]|nr:30S ribosomal protein S4e [DPANN group archaeon]
MKDHLKRLAAPTTWPIKKKGLKWVRRPFPGSHSMEHGLSMDTLLKDMLAIAKSSREVRVILNHRTVLVNGRQIKEVKFIVGLFDVVELKEAKKTYRIMMTEKGILKSHEISGAEAKLKPTRVAGKTRLGKDLIQINLGDGRNLVEKKNNYQVGDTLFLNIDTGKVEQVVKLEKGASIILISGKHIGKTGQVADIKGNKILVETKDKALFETRKAYAFAVGKEKPLIALLEE